jgi:DNA-binding phage protein
MAKDGGRKGIIDKYDNDKLEKMLNLLGVEQTAKKIGVSSQGLYKNMEKRGYRTKTIYILDKNE